MSIYPALSTATKIGQITHEIIQIMANALFWDNNTIYMFKSKT